MHSKEDVKNMWKELEIDENVRGEEFNIRTIWENCRLY